VAWLVAAAVAGVALGVPVGRHLATGAPAADPTSVIAFDTVRDVAAPGLVGRTLDGDHFDLTAWRGEVVLVGMWASWCTPCRTELRLLADASVRWSAAGVRLVTLNVRDDIDAARSMLAELGNADLPAVSDPAGTLALAWGVHSLPQTFLVDRAGRIRLQRFGPVSADWLDRGLDTLLSSPPPDQ
jgi:cytochrome c biogenesis protein CcmG, thiol:disulfide interchange protein DsbE